jgi:hypothetical protein
MDAYVYQGALWCADCGTDIIRRLIDGGLNPDDYTDERTYDSGDFPKGPYSDGGGEADSPNHCDGCKVFLDNPLTADGDAYVIAAVVDFIATGRGDRDVIYEWITAYDISLEDVLTGKATS